jgi:hypothetical protein
VTRALAGLALYAWLGLAGCAAPVRSHALVVRELASKCALVRFSFCAQLAPEKHSPGGSEPR